ncbi:hypothetical protein ACH4MU_10410 [Streptomyces albidoflavus]|uniref:hypothetical protein n=1 Tax=Streptomyces albidoflavus TaxID=1886 RepID=UPI0005246D98|nr:hypothetical protein [Streptomyces albidoflavus]MBO1287029.1 hypothetical protein [Streptomyces sampsonii]
MSSSPRSPRLAGAALGTWRARQWAVAALGALATALVVGVSTDVVPTPLFSRAVPVQWWNYPALSVTAVLAGLTLSTYVRQPQRGERSTAGDGSRTGAVGGLLTFFAVGCPVCNKLVLVLLGASGAMSYWAPLQPLLAEAALRRLSSRAGCPVPVPA